LANEYGLSVDEIFLALTSPTEESETVNDWAKQHDVQAGLDQINQFANSQTLTCFIGEEKTGQAQIRIKGEDLKVAENKITLDKSDLNVSIDCRDLKKVWSIKRDSEMHSLWLLNKQGDSVMCLQA